MITAVRKQQHVLLVCMCFNLWTSPFPKADSPSPWMNSNISGKTPQDRCLFGQRLWSCGWGRMSSKVQIQVIQQLKSFCERVIKKRRANTNLANYVLSLTVWSFCCCFLFFCRQPREMCSITAISTREQKKPPNPHPLFFRLGFSQPRFSNEIRGGSNYEEALQSKRCSLGGLVLEPKQFALCWNDEGLVYFCRWLFFFWGSFLFIYFLISL